MRHKEHVLSKILSSPADLTLPQTDDFIHNLADVCVIKSCAMKRAACRQARFNRCIGLHSTPTNIRTFFQDQPHRGRSQNHPGTTIIKRQSGRAHTPVHAEKTEVTDTYLRVVDLPHV
jgi:hypothetical protein